jgi:hypothetical protein
MGDTRPWTWEEAQQEADRQRATGPGAADNAARIDQIALPGLISALQLNMMERGPGAPPVQPGPESPANPVDETVGRLLHLVGDGMGVKVLGIARDQTKPANDRLYALVKIDRRFDGYNSTQWGELLNVTPEAIRQTEFWRTRKERREGL